MWWNASNKHVGVQALSALGLAILVQTARAGEPAPAPPWLGKPLALVDCLNLALEHNAAVRKSQQDLAVAHGIVLQTRAVALPKVRVSGDYGITDESAIERLKFTPPPGLAGLNFAGIDPSDQHWAINLRLVQSVYEGGRIRSSLRSVRLTREQAFWRHQAVLADTAAEVRTAFYDVLLAAAQIVVNQASVELLDNERKDAESRYAAGTVPQFNVLRAKVELANARPRLFRAKNAHRLAKNALVNLLGYQVPRDVWEDIPLELRGTLEQDKLELALPNAITQALERRPELRALRLAEALQKEGVATARAGYLPSVQTFVGYGSRNSSFSPDLARDVSGWQAGVQLTWDLFDGQLTKGKVGQARALFEKAQVETDDVSRKIDLEVRTAYSNLQEAWEVMESQKQVKEQADEALRLARARYEAGTGTQLDLLSARTALTEASTTQIQAQHDYAVAQARLEHALGAYTPDLQPPK